MDRRHGESSEDIRERLLRLERLWTAQRSRDVTPLVSELLRCIERLPNTADAARISALALRLQDAVARGSGARQTAQALLDAVRDAVRRDPWTQVQALAVDLERLTSADHRE